MAVRYRGPVFFFAMPIIAVLLLYWWLAPPRPTTPEPTPQQEEIQRFLAALQPRSNWTIQEFEELAKACFLVGAKTQHYHEVFRRANKKQTWNGHMPTEYWFFAGTFAKGIDGGADVIISVFVSGTPERIIDVHVWIPAS
jgi:hypothetical protein